MLRFASATTLDQTENGKRKQLNESSDEDEEQVSTAKSRLLRKQSHDEEEEGDESDYEMVAMHDEEEKDLEGLLFGSKEPMMASIEKANRKPKNKARENNQKPREEVADALETRKPVWADPADEEMYFFS
jgi:hypothetical protein